MVVISSFFCALWLIVTLTCAQSWNASQYASSPPVYPSPPTSGLGGWEAALAQAQAWVSQLTLAEKVGLVTGTPGPCVGNIGPIPRLNFSGLCLQDGPLAIREASYASVFPAGLSAAASWDRGLIYQRGVDLGQEFKGKGAHTALGPVAGPLGRSAQGGRNWEGFSPDPYLTGQAFALTVQGMQSSGVQACSKHYIGYEQETQRNPSTTANGTTIEAISSNIDDRAIHELYLWPFADSVRAGTSSIMCSYNRINGSYACQNSKTLNGLLKSELGFQGYVMSDWGGTHSGVASVLAGLDMDMPGPIGLFPNSSYFGGNLTTAVQNGSIPETRLDDMAIRIMTPYFNLGQNAGYPSVDPSSTALQGASTNTWVYQFPLNGPINRDVRDDHATLIRQLGAQSAVLLKNKNNTLPLRAPKNIGVFGNDAGQDADGLYPSVGPQGFEFGALAVGGGSGTGRLTYMVSPLEAIKARAEQDGALVQYILNNALASVSISQIFPTPPDVCLVFLKAYAEEGYDRTSLLANWNSTNLVKTVAKTCPNTVVITHSVGINVMPWADNPNVTAIIAAHLPGQEIGNSIVDVLYGDVNPSGKLPYTIAYKQSDYDYAPIINITSQNTTNPNAWQSPFKEHLHIDYRYFDAANMSVRYEFGYGLSYTTFSLSNISIENVYPANATLTPFPPTDTPIAPGGNPHLYDVVFHVSATVTNTGGVAGAAVPQLYVGLPDTAPAGTPVKVLRGWEKVSLEVGESTVVGFDLMRRDISYWDVVAQQWHIPEGNFDFQLGFSSRDIKGSVSAAAL